MLNNPGLSVSARVIDHVTQTLIAQLSHYESQDDNFLICSLELLSILGPSEVSTTAIPILRTLIANAEEDSLLQISAIHAMMCLGYPGLHMLLDLASRDYQELQTIILQAILLLLQPLYYFNAWSHTHVISFRLKSKD